MTLRQGLSRILLRPRIVDLCFVLLGCVIVVTAGGQLLEDWWITANFLHFRILYAGAAAAAAIGLALARRPGPALLGFLVAGAHLAPVMAFHVPPPGPTSLATGAFGRTGRPDADTQAAEPLRLLYANIDIHNPNTDSLQALVRLERPHVFALSENGKHWEEGLAWARTDYRWHHVIWRDDHWAVALFSRIPLETTIVHEAPTTFIPTIQGNLEWHSHPLAVVTSHPLPPRGAAQFALRNEHLEWLAGLVRDAERPAVLLGDLNTTDAEGVFHDLLANSGLRDSRRGFGWQPSWHAALPWLGIPLDHALVPAGWHVVARRLGPFIGSDHLPVILEITPDPNSRR